MPSDLKERYERRLVQARNFAAVIEVVDRLGMAPDGVNVTRLTWRKEVGRTTYYGRIARLASEIPALILNIAYVTPDTRPELWSCGHGLYDVALPDLEEPALTQAVAAWQRAWQELTVIDRMETPDVLEQT